MFPRFNRPEVFRGRWGELLFGIVTLFIFLGGISTLVWSFLNITWYVSLLVIIVAFAVSIPMIQFLPALFTGSALSPIAAAIGLLALHYVAWSK